MANYNFSYDSEASCLLYKDAAGHEAVLPDESLIMAEFGNYPPLKYEALPKSSSKTITFKSGQRALIIVSGGAGTAQSAVYNIINTSSEAIVATVIQGTNISASASGHVVTVANSHTSAAAHINVMFLK